MTYKDPFRVVPATVFTDAMLVSSTIAETDYAEWASGTTYGLGAYCIRASLHRKYQSLQAGNTNHTPETSTDWWVDAGPTNRWGMLDGTGGTYSTASDSIVVVLQPGRFNTLAVMECDAATVRVQLSTTADGIFYDQTYQMAGYGDVVNDWYEWFYAPITGRKNLVLNDLPSMTDVTLTLTVSRAGGNVSCGAVVLGQATKLGGVRYGAQVGIIDYSRKSVDSFGRVDLIQRSFADTMDVTMEVDRAMVPVLKRTLAPLRATKALWLGSSSEEVLQVFGFYEDFRVSIDYPTKAICTLKVQGIAGS